MIKRNMLIVWKIHVEFSLFINIMKKSMHFMNNNKKNVVSYNHGNIYIIRMTAVEWSGKAGLWVLFYSKFEKKKKTCFTQNLK